MAKLDYYVNERCPINCIKLFSRSHFIVKATQRCTNVIASWTQLCIIDLYCVAWLLSSRIVNGWHSTFYFSRNRNEIVFTYPCHSIPTSYQKKLGELTKLLRPVQWFFGSHCSNWKTELEFQFICVQPLREKFVSFLGYNVVEIVVYSYAIVFLVKNSCFDEKGF